MRLKREEKELLEIKQIKNIESIQLKDIYLPNINGERFLVPGFIVTYGEPSKIIFLTTQDKYFEEFVKRVKEVYLEEKDHVIREGILGKEYIKIDPLSESILVNGNLEELAPIYEYYKGEEGYSESLFFEEDSLKAKMPMISYHIVETLKQFGITIGPLKVSNGRNGSYFLTTTINEKPCILPVYYEEKENTWKIEIGNVLENAIPLKVEGNFTKDGINIHCTIDEFNYSNYTTYTYKRGKMVKERDIYYQDRLIAWKEEDMSKAKDTPPIEWVSKEGERDLTWYSLPWNSFYGVRLEDKCIEEDGTLSDRDGRERLLTKENVYLSKTEDTVMTKEISTKRYRRKMDDRMISQEVLLDLLEKTTTGIIQNGNVLLETYFAPTGPNGFYKHHLAGTYFYQVSDKDLTKEKTRFIGKKDGVVESSDLLEDKIYRKEK